MPPPSRAGITDRPSAGERLDRRAALEQPSGDELHQMESERRVPETELPCFVPAQRQQLAAGGADRRSSTRWTSNRRLHLVRSFGGRGEPGRCAAMDCAPATAGSKIEEGDRAVMSKPWIFGEV
jgi:hypothetical protein